MKNINVDLDLVVMNLAMDLGLDEKSTSYVMSRLQNEGVSFLTRVLPKLSASVLEGLERGFISLPTSFSNEPWCFSRYFQVWLLKIFDKKGYILKDPDPESVRSIRQFCDYFYKLSLPCTSKEEKAAYEKAKSTDLSVGQFQPTTLWVESLRGSFHRLYPELVNEKLDNVLKEFNPRYTSGAFYGSEKEDVPYYIYKQCPAVETGTTTSKYKGISGFFRSIKTKFDKVFLTEHVTTSKTLLVPKDSRGPRIISKEPLHMVRLQMSYFDYMVSRLERISSNRINFKDQSVNRKLAHEGSLTKLTATLDLKDASDRVSYPLVRRVFRDSSFMCWFFDNARCDRTIIGKGFSRETIFLNKLAGMGSGLTFPTMALLIQLSIITSVVQHFHLDHKKVMEKVYVYGDDIVIPTEWVAVAAEGLSASGLCVNKSKSFASGSFRESCGGDYYAGVDVTPVRLKMSNSGLTYRSIKQLCNVTVNAFTGKTFKYHSFHLALAGDHSIYQLDRHCRELVKAGLLSLANYYYELLDRKLGRRYGYVSGDSPCLGRYSIEPIYLNDDFVFERLVAVPVRETSTVVCPYKFLAQALKRAGDDDCVALPFGEFATPRKIQLKTVLVPSIAIR